ncbi:hypothetical protein EXIGLDRAFT_751623 [Exidia glandulosa HHB12029]|uniref:GST N-terminal domain-containing protein n=1 Tax=Exidia glandulosa HHB12029 TaxID=1314781 RepID=A0A165F8X8_EXIGL|nr:hypothetical protein EXIGLDRAFT_751623 [Exidia glandulosa HHB12029]
MVSHSYEIHYFESASRADLPRMMLEVAGAPYKNVFIDFATWGEVKDTMAFGKVPKLVVIDDSDGSRKELFETNAIVTYLAEVLDLVPGDGGAFARAKAASITSNLCDLEDKLRRTYGLPSVEERHKAHEKHIAETIPTYLKYHERLASVKGDFYFGDKVTVADLKLYQMYCLFDDMYAARNPFKTHAGEFQNLNRIIDTLAAGPAGEYARNRRDFGYVQYTESASRSDLPRMMLEVAGVRYQHAFDLSRRPAPDSELEEDRDTTYRKAGKLVVVDSNGARKELFEYNAIVACLAEVLGLMPSKDAFERTAAACGPSFLCELDEILRRTFYLPTVDERWEAHKRHIAVTIPEYLKLHERLVQGEFYFGDKVTVADLKLYQMYIWCHDMYAVRSPFKTRALEIPNLIRIINTLAAGPAGDYIRNRRDFRWDPERCEWVFDGMVLNQS